MEGETNKGMAAGKGIGIFSGPVLHDGLVQVIVMFAASWKARQVVHTSESDWPHVHTMDW